MSSNYRTSSYLRSTEQPLVTDDGVIISSEETYYDPYTVAKARRYWRVQAINNHIVNLFGIVEVLNEPEVLKNSSVFIIPQWAADLQIDCNAFGVLVGDSVKYVAPSAMTVVISHEGVLLGYEVEAKRDYHTATPVARRNYVKPGKNSYLPEEVIHLKNGIDPVYGELMGDNKIRSVLEMIDMDAKLNNYTLDIIKNVASNSFILMPAKESEGRIAELKAAAAKMRVALTRVARGGIALMPERMEAVNVGKNPRDLQFSDLHKDPESAIASTFNVEPVRLKWRTGSEAMTYSNVEQARIGEQQELVYPLAKILERGIDRAMERLGMTGGIELQLPKLWTAEHLVAMQEVGLFAAAEEVAGSLGLPYERPPTDVITTTARRLPAATDERDTNSRALQA